MQDLRPPTTEEIEAEFIAWRGPEKIAEQFGLSDRSSVYRHAVAFGLYANRRRNIRSALERIIERSGDVEVTAAAVVSAVQAYSKINAALAVRKPQMPENKNPRLHLLATPNPADFPVGAPESRAAMRLRLQNIEGSEKRLDVIIGTDEGQSPSAGDWQDGHDGARVRCVLVPVNVPLEDSLRKVGGYEATVLSEAAKHGLVGLGTLMSLKRGW